MKKHIIILLSVLLSLSCTDQLDTHPHSAVSPDAVTGNDLPALINGVYNRTQRITTFSFILNDILGGLVQYYQVTSATETIDMFLQKDHGTVTSCWNSNFTTLMHVNNLINIAKNMPEEDIVLKAKGTGHFMRAYLYMDLVTHWGNVPILEDQELYPESKPASEVWKFIEADLDEAIRCLKPLQEAGNNYYYASQEAAMAMKARMLLYMGRKVESAELAESLINKGQFKLDAFEKIFREGTNTETIFAFMNLSEESNTNLSSQFYNYSHPNSGSYFVRPTIEITTLFEDDDNRKAISWENIYGGVNYFNKYPGGQVSTDPVIIVRIAEMYLISAEAKGLNGGGLTRLNELRKARGLADLSPAPTNDNEFIEAILSERDKELLMENHRYYDLVRTGKSDKIGLKQRQKLLPIPETQVILNPKLGQNPEY